MLLANYLVAQQLVTGVGDRAGKSYLNLTSCKGIHFALVYCSVLRCHPPIMADRTGYVL